MALIITQCQTSETKVEYFPTGQIKSTVKIKNGFKEGAAVVYYTDGAIAAKHNYVNNLLSGMSSYFSPNEKLEMTVNYEKGVKNGAYQIYYPNGNIAEAGNYKSGIKSGRIFKYYEDDSAKLHLEFYIIGVNGEEFPYYQKSFTKSGDLKSDFRTLAVKVDQNNSDVTETLDLEFTLSDKLEYDSASIVVGEFDSLFQPTKNVDTIIMGSSHRSVAKIRIVKTGEQFIRGMWSAIKREQDADSTYVYKTIGFFEEHVRVN